MANWTTPKTWSTEVLTSADMNTYLRDNQTFVKEMAENASIGPIFDGGGADITTDSRYDFEIPGDATIQWITMKADEEGWDSDSTITVDIRRERSSDGITSDSFDSDKTILDTDYVTLDTDTGLYEKFSVDTDWTTSLYENDMVRFQVTACSGVQKCTVQLGLHKG